MSRGRGILAIGILILALAIGLASGIVHPVGAAPGDLDSFTGGLYDPANPH